MNPTDDREKLQALAAIAIVLEVPEEVWIGYVHHGFEETKTDDGLYRYLDLRLEPWREKMFGNVTMIPIHDQGWENEFIG